MNQFGKNGQSQKAQKQTFVASNVQIGSVFKIEFFHHDAFNNSIHCCCCYWFELEVDWLMMMLLSLLLLLLSLDDGGQWHSIVETQDNKEMEERKRKVID